MHNTFYITYMSTAHRQKQSHYVNPSMTKQCWFHTNNYSSKLSTTTATLSCNSTATKQTRYSSWSKTACHHHPKSHYTPCTTFPHQSEPDRDKSVRLTYQNRMYTKYRHILRPPRNHMSRKHNTKTDPFTQISREATITLINQYTYPLIHAKKLYNYAPLDTTYNFCLPQITHTYGWKLQLRSWGCVQWHPKHVELKIERNKNTYKKYIYLEL
jgi:hypothetical protein